MLDAAGNIYGTTTSGGKYGGRYGAGTVFELVAPVGKDGYKEKVLWNFDEADGQDPDGILILDNAGNIYGTTYAGGTSGYGCGGIGCGVVFKVTP